jgi:hypothetical protein
MLTRHPRTDWEVFDRDGREIVRRWYKLNWNDSVEGLIEKICVALENAVREHINETTGYLNN